METLGQRVKKIIVYNGATMTSFAKELNISQSMVSKICSDKAIPSDRTIADICRIYNIHNDWLIHGTGEMVNKKSLESEIAASFTDETSEAARKIMLTLADIPPAVWPVFEEFLRKLADGYKDQPSNNGSFQDGYEEGRKAGAIAWEAIRKAIEELPTEPKE